MNVALSINRRMVDTKDPINPFILEESTISIEDDRSSDSMLMQIVFLDYLYFLLSSAS